MEAAPDSSLDSYFLLLEGELRRHLNAFLAAQAQSGTVDVAGIASPDVRLLLQNLAKRWHSPQAPTATQQQTQTQYKKKNLRLEGSSVIATNFLTILLVLNNYHHRSETHWDTIDECHSCTLRVLRALRDKAGIDTSESVRQLQTRWETLERFGDFVFDNTPKIEVADIAQREGGSSGDASAPRLVLRGLPAEATAQAVMLVIQAQDIDIDESMIHLGEGQGEGAGPAEPYVELKSVEDQRALLELGSIRIRKTTVHFVKLVEAKEVVLYLAKRLATQALAGAWENEFDHALSEGEIACLDDEGHVVAVRLTPEQYAEVEGKEITLIRKPTKIRLMQHHVKLLLPSADMSTDTVRDTVVKHLAERADHLTELIRVDDLLPWAVAQLSSQSAKEALLQARYLKTLVIPPTTTHTSTSTPERVVLAASVTPTPAPGLAHRQWFPRSPDAACPDASIILMSQAHTAKTEASPPVPTQPAAKPTALAQANQTLEAPQTNGTTDRTEMLKEMVMLHYLKKQRLMLDSIGRKYSVTITLGQDKTGFVRVSSSGHTSAKADLNAAWLDVDAALAQAPKRQSTFKFQDSLVRACFKRKLQSLYAFSPASALNVVSEPGAGVGPVVVHMMAADEREIEALDKEVTRSRVRIVSAQSPRLKPTLSVSMTRLKHLFDVATALDPVTRKLRVVGHRESVQACLAHIAHLNGEKGTAVTPSTPVPLPTPSLPATVKSGAAPTHPPASPRRPEVGAEEQTLRLSPVTEGMTASELGPLIRARLAGVEPTFIAVRDGSAYVRYRPISKDRSITMITEIALASPDASVRVEPFLGVVPSWKLCLQGESTALAKLPVDQIEAEVLSILQSLPHANVELELGRVMVWHDIVTAEVGTEACLRRLQQGLPSPMHIGCAQVALRDEAFDRTEQLADVGLAMYLAKRRDQILVAIERELAVSIAPVCVAARESKLGFVRIGSPSSEAVKHAWQRVEAVIRAVVRKRCQFKFGADESDQLVRKSVKAKLNQLHESRDCPNAIYVEDQPSTTLLVVHVLGDSQTEVDAQDPNHIRMRTVADWSLVLPPSVGCPSPGWVELARIFDVVFTVDLTERRVGVAGYRDAVNRCVTHLAGLLAPSGSSAAVAAAAQSIGPGLTSTAGTATAGSSTSAQPEVPQGSPSTIRSVMIEYTPAEARPVAKLQLSIVEAKYGVRVQLDRQLCGITVSGTQSVSVSRAVEHIKKFIKRGVKMLAPPSIDPETMTTTTTTTSSGSAAQLQ